MQELIAALRERARELAKRSIDQMYRDPFWMKRFGARGRQFADEDGLHHVSYLVQALVNESKVILEDYARWLQAVLAARGMCSEHLRENFARLSRLVGDLGLPRAEVAADYLRAAEEALRHPDGPARQVQDLATAMVAAVPAESRREAELLVSYLADAVRWAEPERFARHCAWLRANGYPATAGVLHAIGRQRLPQEARKILEAAG
jgi:hypothetical protein